VLLRELTPDLAEAFQVPTNKGVLIDQVYPDTPAAEAGLRDGDVLLHVDGTATNDVRATRLFVSNRRPGSKLAIKLQRGEDTMELDVTIGELPGKDLASNGSTSRPRSNNLAPRPAELLEGVIVEDLNDGYRASLKLDSEVTGIVVTEVTPNTPAAEKGLQSGDLITEIGRQRVASVEEAKEAYAAVDGDLLLLRVWREGVGRFVAIKAS
jgi:serine protease Do